MQKFEGSAAEIASNNPYLPAHLPEFGFSISWAMCRNPMCGNFGHHYSGDAPEGVRNLSDGKVRIDTAAGRVRCVACGQSFRLHSNRAIRRIARRFLAWSLPFADCPNAECANHGVNLFERHAAGQRPSQRPYRRAGAGRAQCRACGADFLLGSPLRVHRSGNGRRSNPQAKAVMARVIQGAMDDRSVGRTMRAAGIGEDAYYTHLRSAGGRLRDYLAWRNAALLGPRFAKGDGAVRVYTDTMEASLWRWGDVRRFQPMSIPVSVIELPRDRTYYVLAAHPGFLPESRAAHTRMLLEILRTERRTPRHASPWDGLEHPLRVDGGKSAEDQFKALPNIGLHGLYVVPQYAELAHLLVVRKLLSRFPKVFHYMDGSKSQAGAAMTALAEEVRAGRWEIAQVQSPEDRTAKPETPRMSWTKGVESKLRARVDGEWEALRERWEEKRAGASSLLEADPKLDAKLFRSAFQGAHSKSGGWAWLRHPPPGPRFHGERTLWLTQRPDSSYGEVGRELLWAASKLPVDRVHSHLRDDVRAFERSSFRAGPGRSYRDASKDPRNVLAELWIALLQRNFGPRLRARGGEPRAKAMGLARRNEPPLDLGALAWDFRLDFSHAERIGKWLRG